jgi:anti-sigma B factor antagonist
MKGQVEFIREGNADVIRYHGEMTFFFLEEVERFLKNRTREGAYRFVFDMQDVSWIDSMGLGLLAMTVKNAMLLGKTVCMINVNDSIRNLLRLSSLSDLIHLSPSLQEALDFLRD